MFIKNLQINNFKSIEEINLDFNKRVNLLSGDNGMGKSSLLLALRYVITGDLPEKLSEYIRWGSSSFNIKTKFNHLGIDYDYSVKVSEKGTDKELIVGQEIYKNSDVVKKLKTIVNPIIALYSSISEQHKSTQLLSEKPTERLKKIKEILGINEFNTIIDEFKENIKNYKNEIDSFQKEIVLLENIKYSFWDVEELEDITSLKEAFNILDLKKDIYEKNIKLYENYLKEKLDYDKNNLKISTFIKEQNNFKEILNDIKSNIINYSEKDYEDILKNISDFEIIRVNYNNELKIYNDNKKLFDLNDIKLKGLEKDLDELKFIRLRKLDFEEQFLKDLEKECNFLQSEIRIWNEKEKLINEGKCPVTNKDCLFIKDESIDDVKNKIDVLKILFSEKNSLFSIKNNEFSEYKDNEKINEIIQIKRENIQKQINQIKEDQKELQLKLIVPKEIDNGLYDFLLKEKESLLIKKNEYNNQNEKIREIEKIIEIKKAEIDSLKDIKEPELIDKPEEFNYVGYNELNKKITVWEEKNRIVQEAIKYNEKLRLEKENNFKLINEKKDRIDELKKLVSLNSDAKDIFEKEFSSYLIDTGSNLLKEKMNDFFKKSYGRYSVTFSQDKNSIDFFYNDNIAKKVTPCAMASGFEQQILSMSQRVALCNLHNLGIMLLDEVDDAGDYKNSIKMFQSLLDEKDIKQFFIISHNEATKEYITNLNDSNTIFIKNGKVYNDYK